MLLVLLHCLALYGRIISYFPIGQFSTATRLRQLFTALPKVYYYISEVYASPLFAYSKNVCSTSAIAA